MLTNNIRFLYYYLYMLKLVLLIAILIIIIVMFRREPYWSCRDCPSDAEWPNFTTQDITVLNPFLWPYSALPTLRPSNENFTGEKKNTGVKFGVEEHVKAEPDHAELMS